MSTKPCSHCYHLGHLSNEPCPNDGIVSCTKCFRAYVFSKGCNYLNRRLPYPPQALRLVGGKKSPAWITDVSINGQLLPAMLNTGIARCQVSAAFAQWWQIINSINTNSNIISIEIKRKGRRIRVACDVVDSIMEIGENIHIQFGRELMTFLGYSFTMEDITIKSNHSPILSSIYECEYIYNLPSIGEDLRTYLIRKRHFLKRKNPVYRNYVELKNKLSSRLINIRRSSNSTSDISDGEITKRSSITSSDSLHQI